jgi:abequosyltransferase
MAELPLTTADRGTRPLLTLAIPTYNREVELARLLTAIAPELAHLAQVELLISDNASPDGTNALIHRLQSDGLRCTYLRNASNLDADPNFLQCYERAQGQYVWVFGDDDVLFPGSLTLLAAMLATEQVDLVYIAPFGFVTKPNERAQANPSPSILAFDDPAKFLHAVGLRGDLVLISAVIVNKDTVEAMPHANFAEGFKTQLLQLGWTFTALGRMRRGRVIERGLYAVCENHPQRRFSIAGVFGVNWAISAKTHLGNNQRGNQRGNQRLYQAVLNDQLYAWFVTNWYGMRKRPAHTDLSNPVGLMKPFYGHLPLFWLCVYPLLTWPMPLAGGWLALWRGIRSIDRLLNRFGHRRDAASSSISST